MRKLILKFKKTYLKVYDGPAEERCLQEKPPPIPGMIMMIPVTVGYDLENKSTISQNFQKIFESYAI